LCVCVCALCVLVVSYSSMASVIPRVDVVFLAYSEDAGKAPSVTLDSICTVSLYELQRHLQVKRAERNSMGAEAYKHYKWYNAALVEELRTTGKGQPRPLLQAFHWYIETSNRCAFRVEGQQYAAVSLVVAAEVEHWYCARPGHSAQGSRARVVSNVPIGAAFTGTTPPAKTPAVAVHPRQHHPSSHRSTTLERIGEEC
uniref:Uncharacterized protein n=1 Tax=Anopheles coluzzii TaxID=1518534 RepID=A0A8W7P5I1_ANOCL